MSKLIAVIDRSHLQKFIPFINKQMEADKKAAAESQTFPMTWSKSIVIPDHNWWPSSPTRSDKQPTQDKTQNKDPDMCHFK